MRNIGESKRNYSHNALKSVIRIQHRVPLRLKYNLHRIRQDSRPTSAPTKRDMNFNRTIRRRRLVARFERYDTSVHNFYAVMIRVLMSFIKSRPRVIFRDPFTSHLSNFQVPRNAHQVIQHVRSSNLHAFNAYHFRIFRT